MHKDHTHVQGLWNLINVHEKPLKEPFEFTFSGKTVSFSYGNGYIFDFDIHEGQIKWGSHIATQLKNPTPHDPPEQEVITALTSSKTFKEEHNHLHLIDSEGKEVMLFHKKEAA
jgi:heat shock protein HslJ